MGYYWTNVSVFNYHEYLGSFYTNSEKRQDIIKEINDKYGTNGWTRYITDYTSYDRLKIR